MIQKITLFLFTTLLICTSCTEDIEINTPSLQAVVDGDLFHPSDRKAILHEDGLLEITGTTGNQTISISTYINKTGTYQVSTKSAKPFIQNINFTQQDISFAIEENTSEGEIIVTDIYDSYVSGSFTFTNLTSENGAAMTISNGWFYMLPIVYAGDIEEEEFNINPCLLNASLTAKIDGTELITDDHDAKPFGVREPFPSIRITATNGAQDIEIVFSVDAIPGTYDLTGSGDYSATYGNNKEKSAAISGTLTIVEHDKETKCINGIFEYETASGVRVTEGVFDYGY
ncbi:DUF6252 family protein [Aquimarina sp. ERC-38]|uniref:DUF6252 family protein n=1 Tax=Aquimarina sp. ERC-38 TaxID=2949996 RepID=UPI002245E309|nr:DUF6252 family protein [Aquimarina sp. ERC-38]UZO81517.1 DUF6252 family protein [Aquimarina sp. ERC-38]